MLIFSLLLDTVLIGLLIAGILYAVRLTRQLAEMRASRSEMERFVLEFNATVNRAEAGIRGLKHASRDMGDDLEKLLEKGQGLREELVFLIESADQIASRLSSRAGDATRAAAPPADPAPVKQAVSEPRPKPAASDPPPAASSAAERELLRVLQKRG